VAILIGALAYGRDQHQEFEGEEQEPEHFYFVLCDGDEDVSSSRFYIEREHFISARWRNEHRRAFDVLLRGYELDIEIAD
jgi:hypothetical protein